MKIEEIDGNELYHLFTSEMKNVYPYKQIGDMDMEDSIYTFAENEFSRIRELLNERYNFDEDSYISEGDGCSPYDDITDDVIQEVCYRIDNRNEILKLATFDEIKDFFVKKFEVNHLCLEIIEMFEGEKMGKFMVKKIVTEIDLKEFKEDFN